MSKPQKSTTEKKKKKKSQLPGDTAHRMEDEDHTIATKTCKEDT